MYNTVALYRHIYLAYSFLRKITGTERTAGRADTTDTADTAGKPDTTDRTNAAKSTVPSEDSVPSEDDTAVSGTGDSVLAFSGSNGGYKS